MILGDERMKVVAVLDAVKDLLANESRWTQIELARDANDDDVNADDPEAVCWCLQGAVHKVEPDNLRRALAMDALGTIVLNTPRQSRLPETRAPMRLARAAVTFNDRSEHGEVLALIDDTIAWLRREPC
jgi:hypothetical protein